MGKVVFLTGGVRSGKSALAVELAGDGPVLFVATALPSDDEMSVRIDNHRRERPGGWRTAEALSGELAGYVEGDERTLVLDCLGLYVGRRLSEGASCDEISAEVERALDTARDLFELAIVVSNEVGSGLVPPNESAREFTEVLGTVNRLAAERADEAIMMVSGIPLKIK